MVPTPSPIAPLTVELPATAPAKVNVWVPAAPLVTLPVRVPPSWPIVVSPTTVMFPLSVLPSRIAPRPSELPTPLMVTPFKNVVVAAAKS